jgi:hypothetical protein
MQKIYDVTGPVELDVRLTSGEVRVDATAETDRLELELIAHDDESQQLVDNARVEFGDHHGSPQLLVEVPQRRGGLGFGFLFGRQGISCRIRTPLHSSVSVRSKSADVTSNGTLGGLDVATASGDVSAERIDGDLTIKSASADVRVGEVTGAVGIQSASGDVAIDVTRGNVKVVSASGDLEIDEAYGDVSANTVSGDQQLRAVLRGRVTVQSVSGDVQIGVRRGSKVFLDCNTVSGDTSSELDLSGEAPAGDGPLVEVRARTVSGDIRLVRA